MISRPSLIDAIRTALDRLLVLDPGEHRYPLAERVEAVPFKAFLDHHDPRFIRIR